MYSVTHKRKIAIQVGVQPLIVKRQVCNAPILAAVMDAVKTKLRY